MAFNADTYRANRYARQAWDWLAKARDTKVRAAKGEAADWEIERMPRLIELARLDMKLSLNARRIAAIGKGMK